MQKQELGFFLFGTDFSTLERRLDLVRFGKTAAGQEHELWELVVLPELGQISLLLRQQIRRVSLVAAAVCGRFAQALLVARRLAVSAATVISHEDSNRFLFDLQLNKSNFKDVKLNFKGRILSIDSRLAVREQLNLIVAVCDHAE